MMPARIPDGPEGDASGQSVLAAMLAYESYGFSVIPIMPGSKRPFGLILPEGKWRKYQQTRATPEEIERWISARPDTGVGIVCGAVSDGLVCLDVDDPEFSLTVESEFSPWLLERGAWIERSGSGKLHVFVRSRNPVLTSALIGGGRKLADIRGDGQGNNGPSYMVVAPTLHPVTKQPYALFGGDPEHVTTVEDARVLFDLLRDMYAGTTGGELIVRPDAGYDVSDQQVLPDPEEGQWQQLCSELMANIKISRKAKQAIINGAEAGEGRWASAPSNSELDHAIIQELRVAGWTAERIEQAFAWGPLGTHRYRSHKGTHGRGYILGSINKIDSDQARSQEAAKSAEGANFRVDKVVRVGFEEPLFELTITTTTHPSRSGIARLEIDDLMDEHRFSRAVGRNMNFFPTVDRALEGRKFRKFGSLILQMAVEEPVPQSATVGGHLRATIMAFVLDETPTIQPDDPRMVTLGWRSNGRAYVRGGALMMRLQNVMHPKPKPDDVWRTMRGMGAEEVGHRWSTGVRETMWAIPVGIPDESRTNGQA